MTNKLLKALEGLPETIDALTAKIQASNNRLRDQVMATKAILAEMGVASPMVVRDAAPGPAPVPPPRLVAAPVDPRAEEARQEQLRYLETRKAERAALVAQNRGA